MSAAAAASEQSIFGQCEDCNLVIHTCADALKHVKETYAKYGFAHLIGDYGTKNFSVHIVAQTVIDVRAKDAKEAERMALELVKSDPKSQLEDYEVTSIEEA